MICFHILEKRVTTYHIIYSPIDGHIPFIEAFIVPYLLWFPYIAAVVLYLFFTNKNDFYQSCIFLFSGMTIFLIVSAVYPNGDLLRPSTFPRNNIFTSLVKMVYAADTPTNILPSIHARVLLSKLFRGELCIYATYQAPQDNRPAKVSGIRPLTRRLFKIQVYNPYIP